MYYYSIYDKKAKSYGELLSFPSSEPSAVARWFRDLVMMNDKNNLLNRYPEDFVLTYVGHFDAKLGVFSTEYVSEDEKGSPDVLDLNIEASIFFKKDEE